jgi:phosphonate transport system substrate-binding protein
MRNGQPKADRDNQGITSSRRHALALMLGTWPLMRRALANPEAPAPVRLAISESLVSDVNLNDARAAMLVWIKRMEADLNVQVDINPKVFDTTEEILRLARGGQLDSVALNILEYRQIEDLLDHTQLLAGAGAAGTEQYVLLARRNVEIQQLANLRGRRLCASTNPKMCAASAWLSSILDDAHLGPTEKFFGSVATDTKVSRVILPVFFGQADACLTSKRSFDTMCELNPQVAKELTLMASSVPMVVTFYAFHRNYTSPNRERFVKVLAGVRNSPAGRQLATLFQFDELTVRDASCLAPALDVLKKAARGSGGPAPWGRKGQA